MSKEEIDDFSLHLEFIKWDSDEGYLLELDLEYPKDLHNLHNDYPLAPEKLRKVICFLSIVLLLLKNMQ